MIKIYCYHILFLISYLLRYNHLRAASCVKYIVSNLIMLLAFRFPTCICHIQSSFLYIYFDHILPVLFYIYNLDCYSYSLYFCYLFFLNSVCFFFFPLFFFFIFLVFLLFFFHSFFFFLSTPFLINQPSLFMPPILHRLLRYTTIIYTRLFKFFHPPFRIELS